MTFALTKIQPPRASPGSLVARPALAQRLGQALASQRLVLVCAAAGFGKTTALADQINRLPAGTALVWLSCDEDDAAEQLLECLVAALEPYDPPWRTAPESLVRVVAEAATPMARRAVVAELINALDACDVAHGVIVVDDLHRVQHSLVFELFDQLLERLTPRWTLAIASRTEPPLALARLRARGEVAEFRVDDLRFGRDEARRLGAAAGLDEALLDRLHERAQGWPVGLRLTLNALRAVAPSVRAGAAATASVAIDRHAFDFLVEEVIERMHAPLRDFLLASSVLPELTGARCAELTGDSQAALRLEEVERDGLFVTVLNGPAGGERTLRLHDLFRDALEAHLVRTQPERLPTLLLRAARIEPDLLRRTALLQRAGAWGEAEAELAIGADELLAQGQASAVRQALERFPSAQLARSARLQMVRALLSWAAWDWAGMLAATQATRRLSEGAESEASPLTLSARSYHCVALAVLNPTEARASVDALLTVPGLTGDALARTLLVACWVELRGDDQRRLAPHWRRMLDALEPSRSLARWYECSPLPAFVGLPGMREPLQRYIESALRRLPEHPTPLRGICGLVQAWLHLWAGEVERASAVWSTVASDLRWMARPVNVDRPARSLEALLLALAGQRDASLRVAATLVDEIDTSNDPVRVRVYLGLSLFVVMRCAAILDDNEAILAAARRLEACDDRGWVSTHQRAGAAAWVAASSGQLDLACERWRELLANEDRADLFGQVVETRLRLADACLMRQRPTAEAAAVLAPMFERVGRSGEWGAALMAGPRVLSRLAAHDWTGALPAHQTAQLVLWAKRANACLASADDGASPSRRIIDGGTPISAPTARGPSDAALSEREREVLARIAAGDSNKLIARAFDLSPHTVKRHVCNILDKLDLRSRGQAAAWYRNSAGAARH